jgi:hypothetical protein
MKEDGTLVLEDFTGITDDLFSAMEKINRLFTSEALSEAEKERLGKLGRAIHWASHEMDHLFVDLESVPDSLKDDLKKHYEH